MGVKGLISFALPMALVFFTFNLSAKTDSSSPAKAPSSCQHDDKTFRCVEYVKNYDSDTITFNIPGVPAIIGNKISVRVAHIDSPEIKGQQPCEKNTARNAKKLVENLMKQAKNIELRNIERDKYFRILADVYFDGKDLKEILLKNHLAYNYDGATKKKVNWCNRTAVTN